MESQNEQLAIISEARAAVANRLITPWWYHPSLGVMLAAYVLGLSLGNSVIKIVTGTLFIAGALALVATYRRLTGVWVSGFDATGRAGRTAKVMGALVAVIVVAAWAITYLTDLNWPAWILAAVAFAGTIVLGRRFDDELRAQLRAGA